MKPTIGRTVHYHSYGTPGGEYLPEPRAAIITCTYPDPPDLADPSKTHVGLAVLNPTGMFFNQLVPFAETPTPGHWTWPPREEVISEPTLKYEGGGILPGYPLGRRGDL